MALAPDYTTASAVKALLGITDTVEDTEIGLAITAASRMVDHFCRRQFGQEPSDSTRYYEITGDTVAVGDYMAAPTTVSVEQGTEVTALTITTDYRLHPRNSVADGKPYTHIYLENSYGMDAWLKVVGTLGWSSVPDLIEQATQIQALRLFKRKDAAFGIAGSPETGSEMRLLSKLDPDVEVLLRPLRRGWGLV
jgi:hypothetical protein